MAKKACGDWGDDGKIRELRSALLRLADRLRPDLTLDERVERVARAMCDVIPQNGLHNFGQYQ